MNMFKKTLIIGASVLTLAPIASATFASSSVYADEVPSVSVTETVNTFENLSEESILLILTAVDEMPQEMLERGDQEEIDNYVHLSCVQLNS